MPVCSGRSRGGRRAVRTPWPGAASEEASPDCHPTIKRARIAALVRWSQEDPAPNAQRPTRSPGQHGPAWPPASTSRTGLAEAERERRIDAAFRAHMSRLALASSRQDIVKSMGTETDH
jgi:hypothetical protein